MNRTLLVGAGIGLFVMMVFALTGTWYLVLDTPAATPSELEASPPHYTTETAPAAFTLTVEARSVSLGDGTEVANWTVGIAYNASTGERLAWRTASGPGPTVDTIEYQRRVGNRTLTFLRYHTSDRERFRVDGGDTQAEYPNTSLVVDSPNQTYRHAWMGPAEAFTVTPTQLPTLSFLQTIPFTHSGSDTYDGRAVEVYVPQDGWTDTPGQTNRKGPETALSETTGELYVRRATETIVYANLSVTSKRTDRRIGRYVGDPGTREHITLRVRESVDPSLRPDWASNESFRTRDPTPEPFARP
ncbi:MAG: hypothetical protein U5K37_08430 [Natrialbaceae archaeon]|nr:hypothetical protein [Natrialbaceae archaeon]